MPESKDHVCKTLELECHVCSRLGRSPCAALLPGHRRPSLDSRWQLLSENCNLYILNWAKPWHVPQSSKGPGSNPWECENFQRHKHPARFLAEPFQLSICWGLTGKGFLWPFILPWPFPTCPPSKLPWAAQRAQEPWGTSRSAMKLGPCGSPHPNALPHFAGEQTEV